MVGLALPTIPFLDPQTAEDIRRILEERLPESDSLEYKRTLELDSEAQKREVLKDLTGMGNGGGGIVIWGIGEAGDAPGTPERVEPLRDPHLPARLEDIVRAGVRIHAHALRHFFATQYLRNGGGSADAEAAFGAQHAGDGGAIRPAGG